MNKYKVADTVLTILVIVFAFAAVVVAAVFTIRWLSEREEPERGEYVNVNIYEQELVPVFTTVNRENTYAVYFNALTSFSGIDTVFAASENSSLTISIYSFVTDYATSVAGEKLVSVDFSDYADATRLAFGFGSLPAGEYLVVFSSSSNAVMYCGYYQSAEAGNSVVVYENDRLLLNCVPYMSVIFDKSSENDAYFG